MPITNFITKVVGNLKINLYICIMSLTKRWIEEQMESGIDVLHQFAKKNVKIFMSKMNHRYDIMQEKKVYSNMMTENYNYEISRTIM